MATAPTATDDSSTTSAASAVAGASVLGNDTDAQVTLGLETLTVSKVQGAAANVGQAVTLASGAIVTMNADGTYSYNPNGAFNALAAGQSATDSFTYEVSDGNGGTDTATVTVTISGVAKTFTLTTAVDLGPSPGDPFFGTDGNDTYNASIITNALPNSTFGAGDNLNGSGGTDTLNLVISGPGSGPGTTTNGITLTSIERVSIRNTEVGPTNALDATLWSGVQTIISNQSVAGSITVVEGLDNLVGIEFAASTNGTLEIDYAGTPCSRAAPTRRAFCWRAVLTPVC